MSTPAISARDIEVALAHVLADESAEARAARYEDTLRAILKCPLEGADYREWIVQAVADTLAGLSAECWACGTAVHEGPCA